MSNEEKLKALLAEAREYIIAVGCPDDAMLDRIDAALAEPVSGCDRCETLRNLADTSAAEQGLAQRRMMEAQTKREEYASEARSLRARLTDERQNYADAIGERNRAEARDEEARAVLLALCSEFECAVAHADWRAAGSPGMSVPFIGDFASATQLPSVVSRMRWWAREMRKVIGEDKP